MGDFDDQQWQDQMGLNWNAWTQGQEYEWKGRVPEWCEWVMGLVPGPVRARRIQSPEVVEKDG